MDNQRAQEITDRLKQRGVTGQCPMCGNNRFSVNGTITHELENRGNGIQGILDKLNSEGEFGPIECVVTVCTCCGFVAKYSLRVLELLPSQEKYVK